MAKGRIYYYVVDENGEKDGLAHIECSDIEVVPGFVSCVLDDGVETATIWFPRWRVVEIDVWEEDDDE